MTNRHDVTEWLAAHPAPIHRSQLDAWITSVRRDLGQKALEALVQLLECGDLEQQYQAMAAARALGASVEAEGNDLDIDWLVTLPGTPQRRIRPQHQLAN